MQAFSKRGYEFIDGKKPTKENTASYDADRKTHLVKVKLAQGPALQREMERDTSLSSQLGESMQEFSKEEKLAYSAFKQHQLRQKLLKHDHRIATHNFDSSVVPESMEHEMQPAQMSSINARNKLRPFSSDDRSDSNAMKASIQEMIDALSVLNGVEKPNGFEEETCTAEAEILGVKYLHLTSHPSTRDGLEVGTYSITAFHLGKIFACFCDR